jgi:mono/diheme cytochrome c family protein
MLDAGKRAFSHFPRGSGPPPVEYGLLMKVFTALAPMLWIAALLMRLQAADAAHAPVDSARGRPLTSARGRQEPLVDYERQVRPILTAHCLECHNAEKRKGGLSLATYGDALDGGRSGAVIRPGNSSTSLLVHRIAGEIEPQMPKDKDPLSAADMSVIRAWIRRSTCQT